jgi:hypothetical protein
MCWLLEVNHSLSPLPQPRKMDKATANKTMDDDTHQLGQVCEF